MRTHTFWCTDFWQKHTLTGSVVFDDDAGAVCVCPSDAYLDPTGRVKQTTGGERENETEAQRGGGGVYETQMGTEVFYLLLPYSQVIMLM